MLHDTDMRQHRSSECGHRRKSAPTLRTAVLRRRARLLCMMVSLPISIMLTGRLDAFGVDEARETCHRLRHVEITDAPAAPVTNESFSNGPFSFTLVSGRIFLLDHPEPRRAVLAFDGEGSVTFHPSCERERRQVRRYAGGTKETLDLTFDRALFFATDSSLSPLLETGRFEKGPSSGDRAVSFESLRGNNTDELVETALIHYVQDLIDPLFPGRFRGILSGKNSDSYLVVVDPSEPPAARIYNFSLKGYPDDYMYWWIAQNDTTGRRSIGLHPGLDIDTNDLDVTIEGEVLRARSVVSGTVKGGPGRAMTFHLAPQLRIDEVRTTDGMRLEVIQSPHEKRATLAGIKHTGSPRVLVIFEENVSTGDHLEIEFRYAGEDVVVSLWNGGFSIEDRFRWYPKNTLFDPDIITARFTVPASKSLAASGIFEHSVLESQVKTESWRSPLPVPVFGFNYGSFEQYELRNGDRSTVVYSHPEFFGRRQSRRVTGNISERVAAVADRSREIDEEYFGPLPYDTVFITQQPSGYTGQCFTSLVFLPFTSFMSRDRKNLELRAFSEAVLPHEIGHLWWGNLVVPASTEDTWLSEGFAQFSLGLFIEQEEGTEAADDFWNETRKKIATRIGSRMAFELGPLSLGRRLSGKDAPRLYEWLVYHKGAYVAHMLRWMLKNESGDDLIFIDLLKTFISRFGGKRVQTADLARFCEEHLGRDMDWFFDQWVNGTHVPAYEFSHRTVLKAGGGVDLILSVRDTGGPTGFRMPVPFLVEVDGETTAGSITVVGVSASDTLALSSEPDDVIWNPHGAVLTVK